MSRTGYGQPFKFSTLTRIAKRNWKFGFWNNHELETKDEFTQKDFKMNSKQSLWFQFLRYHFPRGVFVI